MAETNSTKKTVADLNRIYEEAETCDREVFAEQRSNILMVAGEHYNRRGTRTDAKLRDDRNSKDNNSLRITKNHMHKIQRHYVANILSMAPGTTVTPRDELSMQDQKSAQLNLSVWQYAKDRYRMQEKTRSLCNSFVGTGECAMMILFDPNAGDFLGYEQLVDENGMGQFDEGGEMIADKTRPRFKGDFVFKEIFGFNLLREAGAKNMRDAKCWIVREMVATEDLRKKYADDPDVTKALESTRDDTYIIFNSSRTSYEKAKNETLVKQYFYPPCYEYPNGYFYIATSKVILSDGELPFGIFPLVWAGFDEHPTAPRGRSILKVARPYQAEINRASSSMAMHQVTLGDDKILYQSGTKLATGALLPGVRGITYQGPTPTVLGGRTGGQYQDYINAQIEEMYEAVMMSEEDMAINENMDPYMAMFSSLKQRKKYAIYGTKFGQFQIDLTTLFLELAKHYIQDDCLIYAVGKSEQVNIPEFRATKALHYSIKVEEMSDDIETQLGKQLSFQHVLQYVGTQLDKDEIGKLITEMPFGNFKESSSDFTLDYNNMKNDMLALERGEECHPDGSTDPSYVLKRLANRMKKPDFKYLDPQIRAAYDQYKQECLSIQADQQAALAAAKNEFIPANGALIACDMYIEDPEDPQKASKRVRLPQQALQWLIDTLQQQGMSMKAMEGMNEQTLAQVAQMFLQKKQQSGAQQGQNPSMMSQQGGMSPPQAASPMPMGVQ